MLIHVVQRGDTISAIAARYGVSVARLLSDNGLTLNSRLAVGQALIVTLPLQTYRVQPGDSLFSISRRFGISEIELIQNNPTLATENALFPGQELTISFRGTKRRAVSVMGYAYPYIRRNVLLRALPYLTYLAIFSYGFNDEGGLIGVDDTELIRLAYEFKTVPVMVLTTIDESGTFSGEKAKRLLSDTIYQNTVLDNVISVMREKGYLALDVDFEYVPYDYGEAYLDFLQNARDRLLANGFTLSVALAPKTYANQPGLLYEAHNYPAIGAIANRVLLMTYEWGYTYGPPLAVAPLPQVEDVVRYAVSEIPRNKIYMGIPNYGYDWTLPYEQGTSRAQALGNQTAVQLAAQQNAEIQFDTESKSPYFYYTQNGRSHIVWFEDVRSIDEKLRLADRYNLAGLGYWNIMFPFAQNWALFATSYDIIKLV